MQIGDRLPRLEQAVHCLVRDHARDEVPHRQGIELGGLVGRVEHRPQVAVGEDGPRTARAREHVDRVDRPDLPADRRGQRGDVGRGERPVVVPEEDRDAAGQRRDGPPERALGAVLLHAEHRRVLGDDVGERRRLRRRHVGPEVDQVAEQHELAHGARVGHDPVEDCDQVRLVHRPLIPVRRRIGPDVNVAEHDGETLLWHAVHQSNSTILLSLTFLMSAAAHFFAEASLFDVARTWT